MIDLLNKLQNTNVKKRTAFLGMTSGAPPEKQILKLADDFIIFRTMGDAHGTITAGAVNDMKYVDGFVIVVPEKNMPAYREMAKMGAKVWKKHGALEYYECAGDDMEPEMAGITFPRMTKAKAGETVVFSFIVFKSRAHRDEVNAKVMQDPMMNDPKFKDKPMPFEMKRMAYGGFSVMVEG